MRMSNVFQLALRLLIAFAIGCFGMVNAKMQVAYIDIEKNHEMSMQHHEMMQAHCADEEMPQQMAKQPHKHTVGCIDCQILHCQNINYALADHEAVLQPLSTHIKILESPPIEYYSATLSGHLQKILRPPRV